MRDDGILTFYDLQNVADNGRMPDEKLVSVSTAFYGRRTVGMNRLYAARGANQDIDVLVRCFNTPSIPVANNRAVQYVILEDGLQYRIDAVQEIVEIDALDLTLVRLEDFYDVADET